MTTVIASPDDRSIVQILFSRKREVDIWPSLRGGQIIRYPARRNPGSTGSLSAMLCKACVVALKGDVLAIETLAEEDGVCVRSRSQSGSHEYRCCLLNDVAYLPRGEVTYHLGLLYLAQAMACPTAACDLLDALEEILTYRDLLPEPDGRYDDLLMHLADELYYWVRYRDAEPAETADRLKDLRVREVNDLPEVALQGVIDPRAFTDLAALRKVRLHGLGNAPTTPGHGDSTEEARFRGPQLPELVESLDLGMHCLLVGPTATGKSLCALEAFDRTEQGRPVYVIEGHESLREFDLLGGYVPDGGGAFAWADGVMVKAMLNGGFLFVDEANRMPTRTLNVLLGVLSRGVVVLTERGSQEIESVPDFQVVMAMNLGQGYAVNSLDRALLDRFSCILEFRYLAPADEEDLLVQETGIERSVARTMIKVANETRRLRRNREISGEVTPRALFAWVRKFKVKRGRLLDCLQSAASVTWLHQVAGVDADGYLREDSASTIMSLIEAHTET
ncbi:MAG: AAA family ATPase [Dehalococcoidia bacterium]|nr:AAA family ATPase [Dehalococcoidia bacterium]